VTQNVQLMAKMKRLLDVFGEMGDKDLS